MGTKHIGNPKDVTILPLISPVFFVVLVSFSHASLQNCEFYISDKRNNILNLPIIMIKS